MSYNELKDKINKISDEKLNKYNLSADEIALEHYLVINRDNYIVLLHGARNLLHNNFIMKLTHYENMFGKFKILIDGYAEEKIDIILNEQIYIK